MGDVALRSRLRGTDPVDTTLLLLPTHTPKRRLAAASNKLRWRFTLPRHECHEALEHPFHVRCHLLANLARQTAACSVRGSHTCSVARANLDRDLADSPGCVVTDRVELRLELRRQDRQHLREEWPQLVVASLGEVPAQSVRGLAHLRAERMRCMQTTARHEGARSK